MSKKRKVKHGSIKITGYMILLAGSALYIGYYYKSNKPINEYSKFKLEQSFDDYYSPMDIYNMALGYVSDSTMKIIDTVQDELENKMPTKDKQETSLIIKEEPEEITYEPIDEITNEEPTTSITEDFTTFPIIEPSVKTENISSDLLDQGYKFDKIDFESLFNISSDIRGWLTIDGTVIDYPVMQYVDNEYYLHHDIQGKSSKNGMIFQDCRNQTLESFEYDLSDITILYGHHMKNGSMFADLCKFKEQKFVDKHPFGVFYSTDGYAYKISFFAGHVVSGKNESVLYREDFRNEEEFYAYIDELKDTSMFTSDVEVNPGDKIMAMVTCSYEAKNSRFVLYGKLEKQYINRRQMINGEKTR